MSVYLRECSGMGAVDMGTEQIQFKQMTFEMAFYSPEGVDGVYQRF